MERAILYSAEWSYFLKNGSLVGLYKETEISAETLEVATLVLQHATYQLIFKSCDDSIAKELRRAIENGKIGSAGLDILKYLELKFSEPTVQDLFPFFKKLSALNKMSIEDRLEFLEKLVTKIRSITDDKEDEMVAFLLLGCSAELHDAGISYLGRNKSLTIKDVLSLNKSEESDTAMFSRSKPWKKNSRNQAGAKPRKPCPACRKMHFLSECPAFKAAFPDSVLHKDEKPGRGTADRTSGDKKVDNGWVSFLTDENPGKPKLTEEDWVLDSGSTCHVCHDRDLFTDFKPCHGRTITGIAGSVAVEGEGTVRIGSKVLHNVAYVPTVPVNLISLKAATRRSGSSFLLNSTGVYVGEDHNWKKVGTLKNDLFLYNTPTITSQPAVSFLGTETTIATETAKQISDTELRHARLGHPGVKLYNTMARLLGYNTIKQPNTTFCPTCCLSKAVTRKGVPSLKTYTHPLELIQVDICGGFRYDSYNNKKYFLTIRDAATRYYSVCFLEKKSEAADKLIEWIQEAETHFLNKGNFKVKNVRTDNGGEFTVQKLHDYFKSRGIVHQLTVPYNSFQNGAVERAHRSIEEKTRCLLIGGRVPPSLWTEAVSTAVYLLNRLPLPSHNNMIPLCRWKMIKPSDLSLNHLRTFGCLAYCTIPPQLRDGKLAPTAISGVLVGYESKRHAYRIYHPESGKIFVSAQVQFDETTFPLEGTEEVKIAHDFATSAANGVPRYPSSKSTSDNCVRDNTTIGVGGYGSFAPLLAIPENNDNHEGLTMGGASSDETNLGTDLSDDNWSSPSPETDPSDEDYIPSEGPSDVSLTDDPPYTTLRREPATTESETTTTTEDSDIDITEDKTPKENTPESPEVALPPTPRPPSPETTYTVEVTENQSTDVVVDRFVKIIEEQNRLLAQALEIQSQLTSHAPTPSPTSIVPTPTSTGIPSTIPSTNISTSDRNIPTNNVVVQLPVGIKPTTVTVAPANTLISTSSNQNKSSTENIQQFSARGFKRRNTQEPEATESVTPPQKLAAIEAAPKLKRALPAPASNNTTRNALQPIAIESTPQTRLALPPPRDTPDETSTTLRNPHDQSLAQVEPVTSFVALPHPSYAPTFTFSSIAIYPSPSETSSHSLLVYDLPANADSMVTSTQYPSFLQPIPLKLNTVLQGISLLANASTVPKTLKQAQAHPESSEWKEACLRELKAFQDHKTYELMPLPEGRKPLGSRWVFSIKSTGLKKARLVAQGYTQQEGIDYTETFAPVVRYDSVRVFLALSACLRLTIHQMDVNTAFLNSKIDSEVYVRQPPGFVNTEHPDYVWRLNGGMYGLKQAPLLWNGHINRTLQAAGFQRHDGDFGIYFRNTKEGLVLVALYVDDILIAAPSSLLLDKVKSLLTATYSMKDLGVVNKFLGMNIHQGSKAITLSLEDYINSAASSTDIPIHRPVYTPLSSVDPLFNCQKSPLLPDVRPYQSIIGQLIFIANAGRPDVAYAVSILSRFLKEPRQVHMHAANRVLQYLYTTRFRCLKYSYGTSVALTVYSDAATCSRYDLPYSTGGYCTKLAGGTITWSSKRITSCVCLSSTQAEYISASNAVRETEWLTNLISHMGIEQRKPVLYVDNTPAIQLAKYPVFHSRTKHIAIHYHNIRHAVENGQIDIKYIETGDQLADILTKALSRAKFEPFRDALLPGNTDSTA